MSEPATIVPEAFGPNLRRARLKRGISLDDLAARTKVDRELWEAMERNDFSRWPRGLYARAYIREYANAVGLDPGATVDDFCRSFPHGDRRAAPLLREHAEIVGHTLEAIDEPPAEVGGDRRQSSQPPQPPQTPRLRALRALLRRWSAGWLTHDRA
jgi:transcriptional regulator with XRE-family HTH domain